MKKRVLSLLLCVALCLSLLPTAAFAAAAGSTPMQGTVTTQSTGTQSSANPFTDVSESDWCYDAVNYVYVNSIFRGVSETEFAPNGSMTRGMFVTVLGRLAGINAENYAGESPFSDVPKDMWCAPYVAWAAKYGVVNGVGDGTFMPDSTITREQMAAIFVRYCEVFDVELSPGKANTAKPADLDEISPWFVNEVLKFWELGLMQGDGVNFTPKSDATRAQCATLCMRMDEAVAVWYSEPGVKSTRVPVDPTKQDQPSNNGSSNNSGGSSSGGNSSGGSTGGNTGGSSDKETSFYSITVAYPASMAEADKAVTVLPDVQYIQKGQLVYSLETPTRNGYVFAGWYSDAALTQLVSSDAVVDKDLTLYPKMVEEDDLSDALALDSLNYVSKTEAPTNYTITVKAPSAQAVNDGLTLIAVTDGNEALGFSVTDNGGGTYTVKPTDDLKEGKTYQFAATDRDKVIDEEGRALSEDDYVLFIHDGKVQSKAVQFYNIFTARKEADHLSIDDSVKFIPAEQAAGFDSASTAGLFTASMGDNGGVALQSNDAGGTFTYSKALAVGDVVAIYNGQLNADDKTVNGDVSYVEITSVTDNGGGSYTYTYVTADLLDVMFVPDVFPIPYSADQDGDDTNSSITIDDSFLDFSCFEYPDALDENTTVDVGDYLAFYEGTIDNPANLTYAKISSVADNGDGTVVLTYTSATQDDITNSVNSYLLDELELDISDEDKAKLENEIVAEAMESGFAEQAVRTAVQSTLGLDEDFELGTDYLLGEEQIALLGLDSTIWKISLGKGFSMDNIRAEVTEDLQKVTEVNKNAEGVRIKFNIKVPLAVKRMSLPSHGEVLEQHTVNMLISFEQEVSFSTKLSVDLVWDNWAYLVWWVEDAVVDAAFELGSYTGVGMAISFAADRDYGVKAWDENNLNGFSAEALAARLNNLMTNSEALFGSNDALLKQYEQMMTRDIDYAKLLEIPLKSFKGTIDPYHIVCYQIQIKLIFNAKLNSIVGASFENLMVREFSFHISVKDKTASTGVTDKQTPYTKFNFYLLGELGIRAGVKVYLSVGIVDTKIGKVGVSGEVGVFLDMYGFFYYQYEDVAGAENKLKSQGGLYASTGVYLNLDLFVGAAFNLLKMSTHLYSGEWEIWNSGNRENIVGLAYTDPITLNMYDKTMTIDRGYFALKTMNVLTGHYATVKKGFDQFAVTISGSDAGRFRFDKSTGLVTVSPEMTDLTLSADLTFTYTGDNAVFATEGDMSRMTRTIHLTWTKVEPNVYFVFNYTTDDYTLGTTKTGTIEKKFLEGQAISGLDQVLPPARPGYDFIGWRIVSCDLDNVNSLLYDLQGITVEGSMLDKLNYLSGATWNSQTVRLEAVYRVRDDITYTIQHWLRLSDGSTKLLGTDTVNSTPGYQQYAAIKSHFLHGSGYAIDWTQFVDTYQGCVIPWDFYVRGDSNTVVDLYYDCLDYQLTLDWNNDLYNGENAVTTSTLAYLDEVTAPVTPTIPGFTFKGWSTSKDGSTGIVDLPDAMPAGDVTYYAVWGAAETRYDIEYYLYDRAEGGYVLKKTKTGTAPVGTSVYSSSILRPADVGIDGDLTLKNLTVTKYTSDSGYTAYDGDYLDGSGNLRISAYYQRTYHTCTWLLPGVKSWTDSCYKGQEITFPEIPAKAGYTAVGWKQDFADTETVYQPGDKMTMGRTAMSFTAVYEAGDGTAYTVEHLYEGLTKGDYTGAGADKDTDNLSGKTGDSVTPAPKSRTGYVDPETETVTIAGDGTTKVTYKYARRSYQISYVDNGGSFTGVRRTYSYRYGVSFDIITSGTPSKSGYTFAGWYIQGDASETLVTGSSESVFKAGTDLTLVAEWEKGTITYKVEHYQEQLDGSYAVSHSDTLSGTFEESVTATPASFTGFTYDAANTDNVVSGTIPATNDALVLKLYYTRNSYDASWYDYDGTTALGTTSFKYGETITALTGSTPTRTGYTWDSWNIGTVTMPAGGESFNANTHGSWTANTYTVEFNANGGTGTMASLSFTYDQTKALSANSFTCEGKVFAGWSTTADGTVVYADQAQVKNLTAEANGTVTLYAQWTVGQSVSYTVEHYLADLDGDGYTLDSTRTQTLSAAENSTVTAPSIAIPGFTYDSENEGNVTSGLVSSSVPLTLKLYYTRNSYTLTLDFNGESMKQAVTNNDGNTVITGFDIENSTRTLKYGRNIMDVTSYVATGAYAGYTFDSWQMSGSALTANDTMPAKNLTLTAKWTPVRITVTLNNGSSTATGEPITQTYAYGSTVDLSNTGFANEDKFIYGWNWGGINGQGAPIANELVLVDGYYTYYSGSFVSAGDVELYAHWCSESSKYAVTFNSNDGTNQTSTQYVYGNFYSGCCAMYTALQENPFVRDGYEFVGWATSSDASSAEYHDRETFTPTYNDARSITLYAVWREITTE